MIKSSNLWSLCDYLSSLINVSNFSDQHQSKLILGWAVGTVLVEVTLVRVWPPHPEFQSQIFRLVFWGVRYNKKPKRWAKKSKEVWENRKECEEMVEIEKELRQRKELLELKCRQLEQYLPEPKDEVSYLRSSSEMLIWVSFGILPIGVFRTLMWSGGKEVKSFWSGCIQNTIWPGARTTRYPFERKRCNTLDTFYNAGLVWSRGKGQKKTFFGRWAPARGPLISSHLLGWKFIFSYLEIKH